jgi:DNA-directed RNA polymerase subunit alpha
MGSDLANDEAVGILREAAKPTMDPEIEQKLNMTVQELDLSVRANNCLESARIQTVRDLVLRGESDLLKVRSFGKTSLREVKRRLQDMGLRLGMSEEELANISRAPITAGVGEEDTGDEETDSDSDGE